jgi:hypothetical protein
MSAYYMLYTHYPSLTDVWTNHLLSFLIPHMNSVRNQFRLVCWQLNPHVPAPSKFDKIRTSWLNDNVAFVQILSDQPFRSYLVSLCENGVIQFSIIYTPLLFLQRTLYEGQHAYLEYLNAPMVQWDRQGMHVVHTRASHENPRWSFHASRFLTLSLIRRLKRDGSINNKEEQ